MTSRRHFLQAASAGIATSAFAQRTISPNDKIRLGAIGIGGMGMGDIRSALKVPGVELVAVADAYQGRLERARELWGSQVAITRDYRELLNRSDIDAVIVATPDHWHQKISIDAMEKGKDVYCEKPMIQRVSEGAALVDAEKRTKRIIQIGSQRVSSIEYLKAKQLFESGAIGTLNLIEAWWDRNSAIGAWQYSIPTDASPETISWDMFLGKAPKRPFDPVRMFRWRNYQDYGTGVAGDLFVHLFSGMHHIIGATGPEKVYATGGLRYWDDGRDVPDVMLGLYDYPKTATHPAFTLALRVNFVSGAGETSGFRFVGSEGILTVGRGVTLAKSPRPAEPGYTIDTFTKAEQEKFLKKYREHFPQQRPNADAMRAESEETFHAPRGYNDHEDHHRVFFEAVRSRKPVVENSLFGFRAAGPAVLSNVSYAEKRAVKWNPETLTAA